MAYGKQASPFLGPDRLLFPEWLLQVDVFVGQVGNIIINDFFVECNESGASVVTRARSGEPLKADLVEQTTLS
jgi:hypothetical protein